MQTESQLIIIGAGGHGSELVSYLADLGERDTKVHLAGFVDEYKLRGSWEGAEILGDFAALLSFVNERPATDFKYITAVGDNQARRQLVNRVDNLAAQNLFPWTLRHPLAMLGRGVEIGSGTCLCPGCIVTTRVRIGQHCILNVNSSISHDCHIGDFVNLNPGVVVCGNVQIGTGCYIGAGATVINKVSIGEWSTIGAGAVVIGDIPSHVTAVGVPARVIKQHVL